MFIRTRRGLLLAASSLVSFIAVDDEALAQTDLPTITVTAPSPIVRRAPPRHAAAAQQPEPQATPAPVTPSTQGVLPVVTDQFATVTVVSNGELRRSPTSTLGDLLFSKPGITGSSFAPGASSRPVIRGLDVNRVGVLENGIGAGGASDLGEDHFVPTTPLMSDQVEVIRGPATLRYGSQSIGGVVYSTNNRIPSRVPPCRDLGALAMYSGSSFTPSHSVGGDACFNFETRGAVTSADNGLEGGVLLDAAAGNVAVHADAYRRRTEDYRIPRSPYLLDPARPFDGRQRNSFAQTNGGSVGASWIGAEGFLGFAITQNNALYGIPGLDGEEHNTRINARETKFTSKGEYRPTASGVDAVRFWFGATDYKHNEIGLETPGDLATAGVRQTFTNKEQEGRVELQLLPFDIRFASLTTALGVQLGHQELNAPGDIPGPLSGLFSPNENSRIAGYLFNEFKFSDRTKAQIAGRIEHASLTGTTPDFPPGYLPDGTPLNPNGRALEYAPKSISIGLIQNLPYDLVASITAQRVERAPKPAELFSRGPHDATATFDISNPNLDVEVANSLEVGLRRSTGPLRFEATAYYTRFNHFIYRRLTGIMCDETFDTCGAPAAELNQAVYSQRDAIFRGGEFQAQYDVAKVLNGVWGLEGQFDIVRATFTDGTNVPRITPMRLGGGLFYRDANWLARVNLLHGFRQNDVAVNETPTEAYNLLRAEISYTNKFRSTRPGDLREYTIGLVGNNLLDEDIRNHVSYTKDEVLMPGASVRAFANIKF